MLDINRLPLPELFRALTGDGSLRRVLEAAFLEDLGTVGDVTSASIIPEGQTGDATLAARKRGIVAGLEVVRVIAAQRSFAVEFHTKDGEPVAAGSTLATLQGDLRSLLAAERVMLNFVGRLSGVATVTRQFVEAVAGTKSVICDTRKTTPGLRTLEKYAVRCGGGTLHRLGLFDAALYKDNHLAGTGPEGLAGLLTGAVRRLPRQKLRFVQVEVDTLEQLEAVLRLEAGMVDMVLLDNMSEEQLRLAVTRRDSIAPRLLLECSGGVSLDGIRTIAQTGVDRISVGALTHSAPWLDIGMDLHP